MCIPWLAPVDGDPTVEIEQLHCDPAGYPILFGSRIFHDEPVPTAHQVPARLSPENAPEQDCTASPTLGNNRRSSPKADECPERRRAHKATSANLFDHLVGARQ